MGFFTTIFRGSAAATPPPSSSPAHTQPGGAPHRVRRELVRVAFRDTLLHAGIPLQWMRADPAVTQTPAGEPCISVRLVQLHWDARLPVHAVALQKQLVKRIEALDPAAGSWLADIQWKFDLADDSGCPALPHPGSWTSDPETAPMPIQVLPPASADVISGPAHCAYAKTQPLTGFDRTVPMKRQG